MWRYSGKMRYLGILLAIAASLAVTDIQGRIESADSSACSCLRSAIKFLSFFPCINGSEIQASPGECDVFAYPAALLAAEHINSHPSILKFPELGFNTSLRLVERETMNDVAFSSFSLAEYFRNHQPGSVHGIIGPSSPATAEKIAYIAGNKYGLYQISYGDTDLSLSNRERYPLLFSTAISEESLNVGRLKLLDMFGWFKVGLVSSKSRVAEHFATLAAKNYPHMNVAYFGSFVHTPMFAFDEIHRTDLRIIVGIFEEEHARNVLCLARRYPYGNLADANHVWILPSYHNPNWWNITESELQKRPTRWRCSNQEMEDILESVLFVGAFNYHLAEPTTSGLTLSEFHSQLIQKTLQVFPSFEGEELFPYLPHSSAPTVYDAVWSLALTWNDVIREILSSTTVCDLQNSREVQSLIAKTLKTSVETFILKGISGIYHFNGSSSLLQAHHGQIIISQFYDGLSHPIGIYNNHDEHEDSMGIADADFTYLSDLDNMDKIILGDLVADSFRWKGQPNNMPPTDGVGVSLSSISVAALCFAGFLLLTAMLFATALLVINVTFRTNKHIKASSPRLNILIIIGLMLVMPSCLVVGLTFSRYAYDIPLESANWLCQLNLWLTCVGYVLTFATMIAKNWRVYRIFYNKQLQRRHSISDNKLLLLVLLLVLPILVVLITWVAVDPLHWQETSIIGLNTELNISYCSCEHYATWNGINISYVLFLLASLMAIIIQNQRKTSMIKDVRVAARFVEEGNSNARATLVSLFIFIALSVTTLLLELHPQMYVATFWVKVVWLLILPVLLLLVIYLPKFGAMYLDRIEGRHLQKQHQYFCAIREEMAKQDVILRSNRKRAQQRPRSLADVLLQRCRSLVVEFAFGTKHDDEGSDENGDQYIVENLENTVSECEFQIQDNADDIDASQQR